MNSMYDILLIEDDKHKIDDITEYLSDNFHSSNLTVRESYQSGLRELLTKKYDLLLLDMSIPTWDKSPSETGGDFEKFGGYKILREINRKKKSVDTILITMFDDFGESENSLTLKELDNVLKSEFESMYKGYVYYSSQEKNWKERLKHFIETSLSL